VGPVSDAFPTWSRRLTGTNSPSHSHIQL
jgi:hypothetical protein